VRLELSVVNLMLALNYSLFLSSDNSNLFLDEFVLRRIGVETNWGVPPIVDDFLATEIPGSISVS
jgi:hypothetical protein